MTSFSKVLDALDECEQTSSRNEKIARLKYAVHNDQVANEMLKSVFRLSMDPFILYRTSFKEKDYSTAVEVPVNESELVWVHFQGWAEDLAEHGPVLHKKNMDIFLSSCSARARKWFLRILNKDLKNGVQWGTVKKLYPDLIKEFNVQLANALDWKKVLEGHEVPDVTNCWIEKKYDGIRGMAFVENGKVKFLTRNDKPVWNTELIEAEILRQVGGMNVVIDGELYAGSWADSLSITKTQSLHPKREKLQFVVFDMMPLEDFNNNNCTADQNTRRTGMELYLFNPMQDPLSKLLKYLVPSPVYPVQDMSDVIKLSQQFLNEGYEGAIVKNKYGLYTFDRSDSWIKIKPSRLGADIDVPIVGIVEGKGRLAGSVGKIDVLYNGVKSGVGTGLSDKVRKQMWELHQKNELVGMLASVAVQELTPDGALRFGVFMRLREDRERVEV
jgi:ATP-dependent DNA ligase